MNCVFRSSLINTLIRCSSKNNQRYCDGPKLNIYRRIFLSVKMSSGQMFDVKELEIPMSYGKLAAKAWGRENGKPILALHGWLDNCGTYDKLLPLLSNNYYIIAIDAPGHGLSSHKPPGCLYSDMDAIMDYRKVVDYLGWDKFTLIGHSFGGALALFYTSIFPDSIEKVVALDIAKPISAPLTTFPQIYSNAVNSLLKIEKKISKPPPVYTKEKAKSRLVEGMHNEITLDAAEILLKRGSRPSACGKGVVFTRDLRCQPMEYINIKNHELIYQCLPAIRCEVLIIMANNTNPNYISDKPETAERAFIIYKNNAKKFVLEHVEGNHFVHLNYPERVAPLIDAFLSV